MFPLNILSKIEESMARKGIKNRRQLSEYSGIPYSTITGFYAKGYDKMKMSTLKTLADCLNVSVDYLVRDEITDPHYGLSSPAAPVSDLTTDETQLIADYRAFNPEGQEKVREYIADLKGNSKYKKRPEPVVDKQA